MSHSKIIFQFMVLDHIRISLHLPLIIFPDPQNISWYTSDPLPAAVSVTSVNSISMLTTPSDSPQLIVLYYDDPDTQHTTMSDNPLHISMKIGYCSKPMMKKMLKIYIFDCSVCWINKNFYNFHGTVRMVSQLRTWFIKNHPLYSLFYSWLVCLPPFSSLLNLFNTFLRLISSWFLVTHSSNNSVWYTWSFHLVLLLFSIWMHVMTPLSEIPALLTIFMPIVGFLKWVWYDAWK